MTASARRLILRFAILIGFLVVTAPLQADTAQTPVYLPDSAVDAEAVIGPPVEIGSPAFKQQMAIVLWLQKTRTPEQVAFVEKPLNLARFVPILGADLLKVDAAALQALTDTVIDQVRDDYDAVKDHYGLLRPFSVDDAVTPVGDARPVGSYPSGHAIRAVVYARLLADLFPQHQPALTAFARQIGYGRVIAGVHYPNDVTAGQTLGDAYADAILAQPAYRDAVTRLKSR